MLYRKDKEASETINRIKEILHKLEVDVVEKEILSYNNSFYSMRVELKDYPGEGANGKGVTQDLARASAYAELMERLQTRIILRPAYGGKYFSKFTFSDEKYLINYKSKYNGLVEINSFLERTKSNVEGIKNYLAPFYSVFEEKFVDLPIRLINMICGSNGLCAGNTAKEAIVQGIGEIMERYVRKRIHMERLVLPVIPKEEIQHLNSYKMIYELEKRGLEVIVKDCTIDGIWPVVGVVLLNETKNRYKFVLGSDPDFDIALQRCITEMFQGAHIEDFEKKFMREIDWTDNLFRDSEWSNSVEGSYSECFDNIISNSGQSPISIFLHQNSQVYKLPFRKFKNNEEAYDYIMKLLKEKSFDVYIRDYSFLGFQTFRIYIPELSDIFILDEKEVNFLNDYKEIIPAIINVDRLDAENLKKLVSKLESIFPIIRNKRYNFSTSLLFLAGKEHFDINGFHLEFFLSLCYMKLNDYSKAFEYFDSFANERKLLHGETMQEVFVILHILLRNKISNKSLDQLENKILGFFEKDYVDYINIIIKNNDPFSMFNFPSCPDCEVCYYANSCSVDNWVVLDSKLRTLEKEYIRFQGTPEELLKVN